MKIIYVSSLISPKKINYIINNSKAKPLQSVQKYHRLICEGLVKNGIDVQTLSAIPMSPKISNKKIWFDKKEKENGVVYKYIPFINIKIIRQICLCFFLILKLFKQCIIKRKDKVFICDILNTTIATITLMFCKLFRIKCIAIVTDLPRDIGKEKSLSRKMNEYFQDKYDAYILVTKYMNEVVNNKNKKPYIVIEGLVDINTKIDSNIKKYPNNVCMYAGGLYEKYGVKMLIDAIIKIKSYDVKLLLYGSGDLVDYIKSLNSDKIIYKGVVTNDIILEEERKVSILINPRFTTEEYTKYSFPSKNIEYMLSGTPLLTTKLPGIPTEYFDYNYVFALENTIDYEEKIIEVLNKTSEELMMKGLLAQKFVLENKNNILQSKKIIKFIEGLRVQGEKK